MKALSKVSNRLLSPHPATSSPLVEELFVSAQRHADRLVFCYGLRGALQFLAWPEKAGPDRADGLWRHTCFEAFIGSSTSTRYCEYNFSPTRQWAAYRFSDYRVEMQPLELTRFPAIEIDSRKDFLGLTATVGLEGLPSAPGETLRLGVTAVIEDRTGGLSYWALKHPAEKPDFHHPESFVIDLP